MINVMRKHHKVLMIFITALVCISFSWYWNRTDFGAMGSGVVGNIYGRNVSQPEFQRNARLLRLASELGMNELFQSLTIGARSENEAYENFSWNLMVLRHEADALGIKPTKDEIAALEKTLPAFQGENGFDVGKYSEFVDHALGPMGFADSQIDELAADQIAIERLRKLLGVGMALPEVEMRENFAQLYSKMEVSVVDFRSADLTNEVKIDDPDIAKYFESHKSQLKTEEKRQVQLVAFALTSEEKKLTGKPRIDVLQKLADRANDFTEALQAKDAKFDPIAAKFQVAPQQTGEFTSAAPDPLLTGTPQLGQTAFSLTNSAPNSDAVQGADGFYIEHLVKIIPARPLTLEEARPKMVEALKQERTETALATRASKAAEQIRDALKSGKSPEEAAASAGVKAEKIPTFALLDHPPGAPSASPTPSPSPQTESPDMSYVKQSVGSMSPGTVSELVRKPDGGLLVILEKREPLDAAAFALAKPILEKQATQNQGQVVFYEWLQERRRVAGVLPSRRTISPG